MIAELLSLVSLCAAQEIGGVPYEKLETRAATEQRVRELLHPTTVTWSTWHAISPFPYAGHGQGALARPYGPEDELAALRAGGAGPDLTRVHEGKNGFRARWQELGAIDGKKVDLHFFEEEEFSDNASCYLYARIDALEAQAFAIRCGSDDGMRLWLNGRLLIDVDVPRGLDPAAHALELPLEVGVNHLLVKVAEGGGDWAFRIDTSGPRDQRVEAQLQYLLDRDFPPDRVRDHYAVATVPLPEEVVLEVGGLDFLGDGTPIVATRRGDLIAVEGAYQLPPWDASFRTFASGLHEPLGVGVRQEEGRDAVYAMQRQELTRLVDQDGDGRADLYECFSDGFGVSGNYHEFAFGPEFDEAGNAWVTLNVGFCGSLGKSIVPYRGWALKITPEGDVEPVCSGLRSPNGIGPFDGAMFYVDNQGDYVATNRLSHLKPGSWHGHPSSLKWREDGGEPQPERMPPAVWFPYRRMGQSAADVALCDEDGAFGPFDGQLFVGDQTRASVMRVFLEEVDGHYQGACFGFIDKLQCGVNRVAFAPDGSMFVGQTDRGWGSVGGKPYGLQRIVHTGEVPFEILAMRIEQDGFELEFTKDVDVASVKRSSSYALNSFTYEYHAAYGAPESDRQGHGIYWIEVRSPRKVFLRTQLRPDYVHELVAGGVRSAEGEELLHPEAYYTCVKVPGIVEETGAPEPRVLFLTHSAGFMHGVVKRPGRGELSHAEEMLTEMSAGRFQVDCTEDFAKIHAENLANYDAVVFYTTGELGLTETDRMALIDWVDAGGAFIGIHCATDTLYECAPYMEMIGGAFDGHPWHEEVRMRVEDADHPAVAHLGGSFTLKDEIYQFKWWGRHPLNVLLSLEGDSCDLTRGKREDGDYANAWWKDWGRGRVFYTALGHRPEVWENEAFRTHLVEGIAWAIGGPDVPAQAPDDAVLLFDGEDLSGWTHRNGTAEATWRTYPDPWGGSMEVLPGSSDLVTRASFGSGLYHVEFRIPSMPEASGQAKGNSGVYLQGRYEVQVLDSFGLEQGLGDCGSIYGLEVADRNACRAPERWQSYDIRFTAPAFDAEGNKVANARMSVWHNGRLIHDDVEVPGPTTAGMEGEQALGPLLLQDHGNPVRYRNVWFQPAE